MLKIDLQHNISTLRIPQVRVDASTTVLALKEQVEKRYGSEPPYVRLVLKTKKGELVTNMEEEGRTLAFYGVQSGMVVSVLDLNPNSIHKELQNYAQVDKYVMSDQTYNQLPENFKKWKHQFLVENPAVKNSLTGQIQIADPQYLQSVAATMHPGQRCQLENGARGNVRFIGKVPDLGFGYFVGVQLDQPVPGLGNGTYEGLYYFYCDEGKAYFQRPNKIEIGDFPLIQEADQM